MRCTTTVNYFYLPSSLPEPNFSERTPRTRSWERRGGGGYLFVFKRDVAYPAWLPRTRTKGTFPPRLPSHADRGQRTRPPRGSRSYLSAPRAPGPRTPPCPLQQPPGTPGWPGPRMSILPPPASRAGTSREAAGNLPTRGTPRTRRTPRPRPSPARPPHQLPRQHPPRRRTERKGDSGGTAAFSVLPLPAPSAAAPARCPRPRSSAPILATVRSRRALETLPNPPARPQNQGSPLPPAHSPAASPRSRRRCRRLPAEAPQETLTPAHGYPLGAIFGKQGPIGAGTTSSVTRLPRISFRSFLRAAGTSLRALTRARQGRDEGGSVGKYEENLRPAAGLRAPRFCSSPDYFVSAWGAAGSTFFTADPMLRGREPIGQRAGVKGRQHQSQHPQRTEAPANQRGVGGRGVMKRGRLE